MAAHETFLVYAVEIWKQWWKDLGKYDAGYFMRQ